MERDRIHRVLEPTTPLTVVVGPPGAGKTALVAGWLTRDVPSGPRKVVWIDVSLAPSARSVWTRLRDALVELGLARPERWSQGGVDPSWGDLFLSVLTDLRRLTGPVVIVLDGYELLGSTQVDRAIVQILTSVSTVELVVLARTEPRALLDAAELALDVRLVRDLALDHDETAAMLRATRDDPPSSIARSTVAAVRRATGGNPAATRALVIAASRGVLDLGAASERALARAGADGILNAWLDRSPDDPDRVAIVRLSVAERLTAELATTLAGADANDLLDRAERDGLGMWRADPLEAFEFTPVVRLALREELARTAPDALDELLRVVAEWSLSGGDRYTGLRAATETGDVDLVESVAARIWLEGELHDRAADTAVFLEQLPGGEVARRPYLSFLLALAHSTIPENLDKAVHWFTITAATCARLAPSVPPAYRAILRTGESVSRRQIGQGDEGESAASEALALYDAAGEEIPESVRSTAARTLSVSALYVGDVTGAMSRVARSLAVTPTGTRASFSAHAFLAGYAATHGELGLSRTHLRAASETDSPRRPENPYLRVPMVLARVHLALDRLDTAAAAAELSSMAEVLRANELWPVMAEAEAIMHLLDGTSGAGEQRLARLLLPGRRPPVSSYWTARLTGWRALLMLTAGRPDQAQALVDRLPLPVPVVRVVRARLLLSDGDLEDAQVLLGARDPAEGPRLAVQRQLLLALAVLGTSEAAAEVALSEATALAGDAGSRMGWALVTPAERDALVDLLPVAEDGGTNRSRRGLDGVRALLPGGLTRAGLSDREVLVLEQLALGLDLARIAAQLYVSRNTVKTQVASLYTKLGVHRRADAVRRGHELGLI